GCNGEGEKDDELSAAPATANCKRGLAFAGRSVENKELTPALAWWYNWGIDAESSAKPEFVPMVWGASVDSEGLSLKITSGARFLLGFNEPNFFEQANLSAFEAAAAWPTLQRIAADHELYL